MHVNKRKCSFQVDSLAILLDDVLLAPTASEEEALTDLSPKECILDYLAGYVAQKFSRMCCTDCVESLKGLQRSPSDLILVKSRGYLQVPSTKLLNLLQIAKEHVEQFTVKQTAYAGVYMGIVEQVLLDNRTSSAAVGCLTPTLLERLLKFCTSSFGAACIFSHAKKISNHV